MNLQQARYAIHRAVEATDKAETTPRERAILETQIATAYALIAIAKRLDKDTHDAAQERRDHILKHD